MSEKFDIDVLATLSRIRLEPGEREKLAQDLEKILGYVKELAALKIQNVEPTTHVLPIENVFRPDEAKTSPVREQVLNHAPKREGNFFKVPKVIEREE